MYRAERDEEAPDAARAPEKAAHGVTRTTEGSLEALGRIEKPEEYSGYGLYDPLDQLIGVIERVFVSEFGEPQYIRVKIKRGFFKRVSILLPVDRLAESKRYTGLVVQ